MAKTGREQALAAAGEDLVCLGDKKKLKELQPQVERLCDPDETVQAPVFAIVGPVHNVSPVGTHAGVVNLGR
jgi:hypothetical protein